MMDDLDAKIVAQFRARLEELKRGQKQLIDALNASQLGVQLIACNGAIAEIEAVLNPKPEKAKE
jgi:hypothetical protein